MNNLTTFRKLLAAAQTGSAQDGDHGGALLYMIEAAQEKWKDNEDDMNKADDLIGFCDHTPMSRLFKDSPWATLLAPEILAMSPLDGCALDCLALILTAENLLEQMVDVEGATHIGHFTRQTVAAQCRVFYFG